MIQALILFAIILLLSGTSIYVSLGLASFGALIFFSDIQPMIMIQRFFGGIDKFALMALPFFILAANLMDTGGLSRRILICAKALVGHISGGLAMTTQVSSMFFGALSGSSPSTVIAIGKAMYPELVKAKYPPSFAAGLLASSGSVALIIPPSITLIVYASVTGVSVGALFMAGIGAGIVYGCASLIYIYYYSEKLGVPKDKKASYTVLMRSIKDAWWALLVPVIILGGIYSGIFTPTEAAGVSVIYAVFIGKFVYKELTFKGIFEACKTSAVTCAQVLVLVAAAQALGWMLTVGQVPQTITTSVLGSITSKVLFLLLLNIVLLVLGMFMEGIAAIIIITPLIFPIIGTLGIDPVHLGAIMISNLAIGMFTPPFGMNIFVTSSITKLDLVEMLPGIARFFVVDVIALALITYIPQISLFIPNLLK
ncbi:MAG: TRAP transporter large permease [Clostridia bacterium]|nr:TRAP transporter large permease [Clostridia bacterium]